MNKYTKDEFFAKVDAEGGFEGMATYAGEIEITDDINLDAVYHTFVRAFYELEDHFDEWNEVQEEGE